MSAAQKITTHLWYDREAVDAGKFYVSAFQEVFGSKPGSSGVKHISQIHDTPSGSVDIVSIELSGQGFILISAGPLFKFTPAVSILVSCTSKDEVEALWQKLSPGGSVLMDLGRYPFSEWYGWTQDRYGLSWQVMLARNGQVNQRITPMMMFVGKNCGKAEEAMRFYASVFRQSAVGDIMRHGKGEDPEREGTVTYGSFTVEGKDFAAMDSAHPHNFTFNEAISFMVRCDTQQEIDYYWGKLSSDAAAEQCGWLKDRYGLSWQVTPAVLQKMLQTSDKQQLARVTEALLTTKKFDIATLEKAYKGA